ncbi:MAG: hypothetical protein ABI912_01595 [Actinomycetota bacterium]
MAPDLLEGAQWQCCRVGPDAVTEPAGLEKASVEWMNAAVPGTAAGAVRDAGGGTDGIDFDADDWWFVCRVESAPGEHLLEFDGLATVSDVWVDGRHLAHSDSMFRRQSIALTLPGGLVEIAIRCGALRPLLARKRPRPRWRSGLVAEQNLRWWRTTLLGRMPAWAGSEQPVGPWRPVRLRPRHAVEILRRSVQASVVDGTGVVDVRIDLESRVAPVAAVFRLGGIAVSAAVESAGGVHTVTARLEQPDVAPWWPHTHGSQPVYPLTLDVGGALLDLGTVGFRTVSADTTEGAFSLSVNGVPVFARGACWVPPDPVSLNASYDELRRALQLYVDAGFNLVRVTGTMVYEGPEFWRLCTELGLLVWQDCMFATLDPPADEEFERAIAGELRDVFADLQGCPAIAVVSGGSECEQQPAMLGLAADRRGLPLQERMIPDLLAELLPGIPYVSSSPTGGVPPTRIDTGVSHYFGVGAYLRPLSDARTAGVRFAAECLAIATPPERHVVDEYFGSSRQAGHHPRWKAAVPRDNGASWDFEDVREHYVRRLFGVDPADLRRADPELALDLGRAASAAVVEATYAEWRRPASPCAGAVVLSMRDLAPGAGWGLVDSTGVPKAPWYAAARVLAPVAVFVTDEGLDGVAIHVVNDLAAALHGTLSAQLFGVSGAPLEQIETTLSLPAHSGETLSLLTLLGEFRDLNHAYRFGPAAYDCVVVRFTDADGTVRAEATHLLLGQARPLLADIGLTARLGHGADAHVLTIATRQLAQWVSVDCQGFQPADSWFHLAPGQSRSIRLTSAGGAPPTQVLHVRTVNSRNTVTVRPT